jgi:replicative DNA helicase
MNPDPTFAMPPYSDEAEKGVLGCILQSPGPSLLHCREVLPDPAGFFDRRHQFLYGAFMSMEDEGTPIDLVTVNTWLRARNLLEDAGGITYVAALPDASPSSANLTTYVEIVTEKWLRRKKLAALTEATFIVRDEARDIQESLDAADSEVITACALTGSSTVETMPVLMNRAIQLIEKSFEHRNQGLMAGISTKLGYLDKLTTGLCKGDFWIVGGRPSMGKTSLLCSFILNIAVEQNIPFGFLSLEMSRDAIAMRLLSALSGANLMHLRTGHLSRMDLERIHAAWTRLCKAPIFIDDAKAVTPAQIRSKARRLVSGYGAQVIGLDHLHQIYVPEARGDERIQASEGGMVLNWVAKTFNVPVLGLAQLNRTFESESAKSRGRRPRMTDLRGSGNLEQLADFIGILWRNRGEEKEEEADDDEGDSIPVDLEVVKQRNGPTGECRLTFLRKTLKYVDRYENTGSQAGLELRHQKHEMEQEEIEIERSFE